MPALGINACAPDRVAVSVRGLDADMVAALDRRLRAGGSLQSILSVSVVDEATIVDDLPEVGGSHRLLADSLEFVPYFAFEAGTLYRGRFNPPHDTAFDECPSLSLEILLPAESGPAPEVLAVFPSGDDVPENLLRFYVLFSESMRRGQATAEVGILGPDGTPAHDVLYRAPVELWSPDMRCLTVLLDPGRLKRGVGPNRQLGPPLRTGRGYTLVIGTGMTDRRGQPLSEAFCKRFSATDAVRQPIDVKQWLLAVPLAGTVEPLEIIFSGALDWGMLAHSIRVDTGDGRPVDGRSAAGRHEKRWSFTPATRWAPGDYRVVVAPDLEDACGNDVSAPFDRDLRWDESAHRATTRSISFRVS
jgi:hypothetical protein